MGRFYRVIPEEYGAVPCTYNEGKECRNAASWVCETTERTICVPCYEERLGLRKAVVGDAVLAAVTAAVGSQVGVLRHVTPEKIEEPPKRKRQAAKRVAGARGGPE